MELSMPSNNFIQKGDVIYKTLIDLIDNKTYQLVNVSATYKRIPPYYALELGGPMPYTPFPGEVYAGTRMTIKHMVDMHFNGISFTFSKKEDMLEVEYYIKQYLKLCQETNTCADNQLYIRMLDFYDPPPNRPMKGRSSFKTKCQRIRNHLNIKDTNIFDMLR